MSPQCDSAVSDATAICATLGVLSIMCLHAQENARAAASLAASEDEGTRQSGQRLLAAASGALREARERMDTLMQDFGDYFNGGDCCSETMTALTRPVYMVLRKRQEGISLDD